MLAFVAAGGQEGQQNESKTASLMQKLGTVERDGGIEVSCLALPVRRAIQLRVRMLGCIRHTHGNFVEGRQDLAVLRAAVRLQPECVHPLSRDSGRSLSIPCTDCIVAPFTGTDSATFLAFPLTSRDALVSLASPAETDTLMAPSPSFIPSPDRGIVWHPAKAWWECLEEASAKGKEKASETEGETVKTPNFIAIVSWVTMTHSRQREGF